MISKALYILAERPYRFINACFISILLGVFLYSTLINTASGLSLNCWYYTHYGILCPSCGLTRAFHALTCGSIQQALEFNKGALWIASFFIIQLILRITAYVLDKEIRKMELVIGVDITLSIFSLLICFGKGYGLI
jgi:hypothetical protein